MIFNILKTSFARIAFGAHLDLMIGKALDRNVGAIENYFHPTTAVVSVIMTSLPGLLFSNINHIVLNK